MPPSKYRLNITVADPVEHKEGLHAYVTYKVKTSTDRPEFQYGQFNVIRRFKDFEWLHFRLGEEFAGVLMPPLPEKKPKIAGGMDKGFIDRRIKELERFMNRVAVHEELSGAESFRTFLCADDAGLAETKEAEKAVRRSGTGSGIKKWFDDSVTIVGKKVVEVHQHAAQKESAPKTPADMKFEEISAYVNELCAQLRNVAEHSSNLVRGKNKMANTLYEFGFAFTQLAKAEEEKAPLGQALLHMGHCADDVSVQVREQSGKEAEHFEGPMRDYVRIVESLKTALRKRQEKKISALTAGHTLEAKKAQHGKLEGLGGKEDKVIVAEEAVAMAQEAQEAAQEELKTVSERVLHEFERFKAEKEVDVKKVLLDFALIQVDYAKQQEAAWQALIPQIEASASVSTGEGGGSTTAGVPSSSSPNSAYTVPANSEEDLVGV